MPSWLRAVFAALGQARREIFTIPPTPHQTPHDSPQLPTIDPEDFEVLQDTVAELVEAMRENNEMLRAVVDTLDPGILKRPRQAAPPLPPPGPAPAPPAQPPRNPGMPSSAAAPVEGPMTPIRLPGYKRPRITVVGLYQGQVAQVRSALEGQADVTFYNTGDIAASRGFGNTDYAILTLGGNHTVRQAAEKILGKDRVFATPHAGTSRVIAQAQKMVQRHKQVAMQAAALS
jgi:hypothetical protein